MKELIDIATGVTQVGIAGIIGSIFIWRLEKKIDRLEEADRQA